MNDPTQLFIKKYNAYTSRSKHIFRQVSGVHLNVSGTIDEVQAGLQVLEIEGVQINMSREDFDKLCQTLYDLEIEKQLRYSDKQLYKLYIEYITWLNLKK
jgi:hypothetical protein